jgi:hypothetical protein
MATLEEKYTAMEIAILAKHRGLEAALNEYSKATGKDREGLRRLYLNAVDQVQTEGY